MSPAPWEYTPRKPRVLIGTTSGAMMVAKTAHFIEGVIHNLRMTGYPAGWAISGDGTFEENAHAVVTDALEQNIDVLFFIDCDMSGADPKIVEKMLAKPYDAIGCCYRGRNPPHRVIGQHLDRQPFTGSERGVQEVEWLGLGCLMVRKKVLKALEYPYFWAYYGKHPSERRGADVNFCLQIREKGFKLHCDFDASRTLYHNGLIEIGLDA